MESRSIIGLRSFDDLTTTNASNTRQEKKEKKEKRDKDKDERRKERKERKSRDKDKDKEKGKEKKVYLAVTMTFLCGGCFFCCRLSSAEPPACGRMGTDTGRMFAELACATSMADRAAKWATCLFLG